jgi:transcription initiation factor TFIIF subunit beta
LKETLEMVAHLVRSGDFAMTWELKPEAKEANYTAAMLGQNAEDDAMDASDNEDVQFENV